jgi:hypothetical protein
MSVRSESVENGDFSAQKAEFLSKSSGLKIDL